MSNDKKNKHIFAGIAAFVALIVYFMTMAPTVSFWDCGEFVACANTLGIPHPPGTPFFVFLARAVIVALPFVEEIAKRVNYISVVSSAATVYVTALFAWELLAVVIDSAKTNSVGLISRLADKLSAKSRTVVLGTATLVSGFLLTFSDTFWFNAVEAEVYGIAMLILMLVSYLGLVWYKHRDEASSDRILIFICYIAFLGVGAHLYTMLTIPAVFALLLVAQPKKIVERIPVWITGVLLCSVIYMVDSFLKLTLGCIILLGILSFVSAFPKKWMKSIRLSLAFSVFALIGYSTHLYIPIRSELNPVIDENNPEFNIRDEQGNLQLGNLLKSENWKSFNDFVMRKQYGSESMIDRAFYRRGTLAHQFLSFPHMGYGGYQMAQYLPYKVGETEYTRDGVYTFEPDGNQPLERLGFKFPTQMNLMGDDKPMGTLAQFLIFLLFNGLIVMVCVFVWKRNSKMGIFVSALYALCSLGLLFYINFADGSRMDKKSDEQYWSKTISEYSARYGINVPVPSANELLDLRQKIKTLDYKIETQRYRGNSSEIEKLVREKQEYEKSSAWVNWKKIEQGFARAGARAPFPETVHLEVRERDYFYTPAFIFMSMIYGIGAGILVLLFAMSRKRNPLAIPAAVVLTLIAFVVPCTANYKEHDRSGLWVPWDYAYNLLNSCRPNAILFTNGDNDTFPLWFAQEVAGIRKDVRVVNLSLGNTEWYIEQMLDNDPILKLSYRKDSDPCVKDGKCKGIRRDMTLESATASNPEHSIYTWIARANKLMPALKDRIENMEVNTAADSARLLQFQTHYQIWDAFMDWAQNARSSMMLTQHKLVLDLAFQNMDKPIEISTTVGTSNFMGLEKYMVQEGMVYHFMKGDMAPKRNAFDAAYTAALIDSVYQFRGLGDGTAFVNDETKRLLSSYISLYLQLSFDAREKIEILRRERPFTEETRARVDSLASFAGKYLEMGMKQFDDEWRCYWAAGALYQSAGQKALALSAVERGLKKVPSYEEGAIARLEMALQQINSMPDGPLPVEKPQPETPAEEPAADSATVAAAK